MLMNLVIIVVVTTLVMAPFVAWILFKEYLARRRFITSIVRPDLGCDLSAEFQAAFKKVARWGGTPYMVVACDEPGVVLPLARVEGPTMTLDVSFRAVSGMHWEGSALVFRARFGKDTALIRVPLRSVVALCSKQTETGVIFRENFEFQGQALRKHGHCERGYQRAIRGRRAKKPPKGLSGREAIGTDGHMERKG